jgi:hypothetical protein
VTVNFYRKRCVNEVGFNTYNKFSTNYIASSMYARKHFDKKSKQLLAQMLGFIKRVFKEELLDQVYLKRLSVFLPLRLSVCLSVFLSICLSVFLSFCLSVFLSFCLSVSLSLCRSVSMSHHPPFCCVQLSISLCLSYRLIGWTSRRNQELRRNLAQWMSTSVTKVRLG